MITIQGKGVSKGIAKGPLYFFQRSDTTVTLKVVSDIEAEKARFGCCSGTVHPAAECLGRKVPGRCR